jgi:hypothetical protein
VGQQHAPSTKSCRSRRDASEVSPTRMHRRKFQKTAARKKKEARESAARALQKTKARLGIGTVGLLKGAISSPLAAVTSEERRKQRQPLIAFQARRSPRISSTNTIGSKESRRLRLQSARCAGKPPRSLQPIIRERSNTYQRGSRPMNGLRERALQSGSNHVFFTQTNRAQFATH